MTARPPLKCDICPKKPRFSDVSHLLTHISSKTHLSNIFKAKVRADFDTETRRLVEDYDQWYAEYNVHDLLAERLNSKDTKVAKPRRAGTKVTTSRNAAARKKRRHSTVSQTPAPHSTHTNPTGNLGPQHFDPGLIVYHPQPRAPPRFPSLYNAPYSLPHLPPPPPSFGDSGVHHAPRANLFAYPGLRDPRQLYPMPFAYPDPQRFAQGVPEGLMPSEPAQRRAAFNLANAKITRAATTDHEDDQTIKEEELESDDESEDDDAEAEIEIEDAKPETDLVDKDSAVDTGERCPRVQLKGIIWPGMDCFDAADLKQRSQRNQKKSDAAYLALIRSSGVTADSPFEVIFKLETDGDWSDFKDRVITGNPTPSSLASSSSPVIPRRVSPLKRAKPALKTAYVDPRALLTNSDGRFERDVERAILGVGKRRLSVFVDDHENIDRRSTSAHPSHRRTKTRRGNGVHPDKENEQDRAEASTVSMKTDTVGESRQSRDQSATSGFARQAEEQGSMPRAAAADCYPSRSGYRTAEHEANAISQAAESGASNNGHQPAHAEPAGFFDRFGQSAGRFHAANDNASGNPSHVEPGAYHHHRLSVSRGFGSPNNGSSTDRLNGLAAVASHNLQQSAHVPPTPQAQNLVQQHSSFTLSPIRGSFFGSPSGYGPGPDFGQATAGPGGHQVGTYQNQASTMSWNTPMYHTNSRGFGNPDYNRYSAANDRTHGYGSPGDLSHDVQGSQNYEPFSWNFERTSYGHPVSYPPNYGHQNYSHQNYGHQNYGHAYLQMQNQDPFGLASLFEPSAAQHTDHANLGLPSIKTTSIPALDASAQTESATSESLESPAVAAGLPVAGDEVQPSRETSKESSLSELDTIEVGDMHIVGRIEGKSVSVRASAAPGGSLPEVVVESKPVSNGDDASQVDERRPTGDTTDEDRTVSAPGSPLVEI